MHEATLQRDARIAGRIWEAAARHRRTAPAAAVRVVAGHAEIGNAPTMGATIGQDDEQQPVSSEPITSSTPTPGRGLFHTLADAAADAVLCTWPRPEGPTLIHRLSELQADRPAV